MASTRRNRRPQRAPTSPKSTQPTSTATSQPATQPGRRKRRRANDDEGSDDTHEDSDPELTSLRANDDNLPVDDQDLTESEDPLPTLAKCLDPEMLRKWPQSRCKEKLNQMRPKASKLISDAVRTEIGLAFQRWEHTKMMICLATNITMRMFNKEIGLLAPTRKISRYVNYLQFSIKNHSETMPQPFADDDAVQDLVDRNKRVGNGWSAFTADEKELFSTRLLLALAGIPDLVSDFGEDPTEEDVPGDQVITVPEVTKLTLEEEAKYRPLYDRLVAHDVLVSKLGTSLPGVSDTQLTRRSLQSIQKFNQELNAECQRHEFEYWLVAASTVPPLNPGTSGWCKVFTSMPMMTKFITTKANFPTIFGAVAQGTSIIKAVNRVADPEPKESQPSTTDKEKQRCRAVLTDLLISVVGKKPRQGLPQGEDPEVLFVQRGIPARLELDNNSSLSRSDLKLGFLKMNAEGRRKWLKDVNEKKFRFVYDESRLGEAKGKSEYSPRHPATESSSTNQPASENIERDQDDEPQPRETSSGGPAQDDDPNSTSITSA